MWIVRRKVRFLDVSSAVSALKKLAVSRSFYFIELGKTRYCSALGSCYHKPISIGICKTGSHSDGAKDKKVWPLSKAVNSQKREIQKGQGDKRTCSTVLIASAENGEGRGARRVNPRACLVAIWHISPKDAVAAFGAIWHAGCNGPLFLVIASFAGGGREGHWLAGTTLRWRPDASNL
jgi:hypothetical protein